MPSVVRKTFGRHAAHGVQFLDGVFYVKVSNIPGAVSLVGQMLKLLKITAGYILYAKIDIYFRQHVFRSGRSFV